MPSWYTTSLDNWFIRSVISGVTIPLRMELSILTNSARDGLVSRRLDAIFLTLVILTEDSMKGDGKPETPRPRFCLEGKVDTRFVFRNGRQLEEVSTNGKL